MAYLSEVTKISGGDLYSFKQKGEYNEGDYTKIQNLLIEQIDKKIKKHALNKVYIGKSSGQKNLKKRSEYHKSNKNLYNLRPLISCHNETLQNDLEKDLIEYLKIKHANICDNISSGKEGAEVITMQNPTRYVYFCY